MESVTATGGHLNPTPDDLLLTPGGEECWLPGKQGCDAILTHGTGCAFSSAFLGRLVLGDSPIEAAQAAKALRVRSIREPQWRGARGTDRFLNLLWPLLESGQ